MQQQYRDPATGKIFQAVPGGYIEVQTAPASSTVSLGRDRSKTVAEQRAANEEARAQAREAREQARFDQQQPAATPGNNALSGEEYLKTLSPNLAAQVKALAEGRRAFPTGAALRSPAMQELVAAATQYDPTLDAANAATRVATRKDFTSGKARANITAINTALGHLGSLSKDAEALDNSKFPLWNTVGNAVLTQSGDGRVKKFGLSRDAVANELMKVFRGSGGSLKEIEEWKDAINSSDSPEQLKSEISTAVELLNSRLLSMQDQYQQGMGKSADVYEFLTPHAKQVFDALSFGGTGKIEDKPLPPANGGGAPADTGAATDGYTNTPDPKATAQLNSFIRAQVPYTKAVKWARDNGFDPPNLDQYNKARAWAKANPGSDVSLAYANRRTPLTGAQRVLDPIARSTGGSLLATYANAASAGIPALLAGRDGNVALTTMRAAHPDATVIGDTAGVITGALGAAGLANAGAKAIGKGELKVLPSLVGDMGYGASYGASENPDARLLGAAEGAALAATGNVAGRYLVAPALRLTGTLVGKAVPKPSYVERKLIDGGELLNETRQNLTDAAAHGLPYSMADATKQLRYLAGSAARFNPEVRDAAETILEPRHLGQADRALEGVDRLLTPRVSVADEAARIKATANRWSQPMFDAAMKHPAPDDAALNDLLRAPIAEKGIREAYDIGLNSGVSPAEISTRMTPEGPVLDALPNWRTLQLLKMGVDSEVEKFRGLNGKLDFSDPKVQAADDWRKRYVARLADLNPDYAAGNDTYSGIIDGRTALEKGAKMQTMTTDQVQQAVRGTPPQHIPSLQKGFASAMGDAVERQRFNANAYAPINGTLAAQQRMGLVFPEGTPAFQRLGELEADMAKTRGEVIGGSPTAQRQQADSQFASIAGPVLEVGANIVSGTPVSSAMTRGFKGKIEDAIKWGVGQQAQRRALDVGKVLLHTDPDASLKLLDAFAQRAADWQRYVDQTRQLGASITSPVVVAAGASSRP